MGAPTTTALLTVPEAAERLRCSREHVFTLLRQGRLSRIKYGHRTFVDEADLDRLIEQSRERVEPQASPGPGRHDAFVRRLEGYGKRSSV